MAEILSAPELLADLSHSPFDLRLEVILAELLDYGYSFDDFLVRPMGLHARRYRRDVGTVSEEEFESGIRTVIEINREGLYDALPKQIFHPSGSSDADDTTWVQAAVEEIQRQRAREKASRRFFLPFEQEFFHFRVRIEQEERSYFTNLSAGRYSETLAQFWGIANSGLPLDVLTNLLYLLPLAHDIVGDLSRTRQCFESVLGHLVELRVVAPQFHPIVETSVTATLTLNSLVLGQNSVLGGEYRETLPGLEITLQALSMEKLLAYLAQGWPAKALNLLCQYFVALETDIFFNYKLAAAASGFYLREGADSTVLGYTSRL